jgi:hypothetical protein
MVRVACLTAGAVVVLTAAGMPPARACSLCGAALNQQTLRQDFEQARIVVYGTIANPRFTPQTGAPGSGVTDFHIARVLKDDPLLTDKQGFELPRYLPIVDPRDPPKFVVFCRIVDGKLDAYRGRPATSSAVLDYLQGTRALQGKDRTQALLYFSRFLDHEDNGVAADAFLEFARSTDQEIGEAAKHLSPAPLRKLLDDPRTPPERLGMFAFLLGACGGEQDADFLKKLIERPPERMVSALDGILGGYIHLRPRQGWDLAVSLLADARRPFDQRLAASKMLRFYHGWKPTETRVEILRALAVMIDDGELADLAIEDLRTWKMWDLTPRILAQYGKQSHSAPIVRRAIVRYALSCRQPEAGPFLDAVRRQDAELVRDLEESLESTPQKN